jgi:hypothetical protein
MRKAIWLFLVWENFLKNANTRYLGDRRSPLRWRHTCTGADRNGLWNRARNPSGRSDARSWPRRERRLTTTRHRGCSEYGVWTLPTILRSWFLSQIPGGVTAFAGMVVPWTLSDVRVSRTVGPADLDHFQQGWAPSVPPRGQPSGCPFFRPDAPRRQQSRQESLVRGNRFGSGFPGCGTG